MTQILLLNIIVIHRKDENKGIIYPNMFINLKDQVDMYLINDQIIGSINYNF